MTSTSSSGARAASDQHEEKHVHHGRTPAAWAGSVLALLAFLVGGIGFVLPPHPNWVVVGIAVVIMVVGLIATLVLRKLGHGAD